MASLSTGGKVIVISTPNGYDPIYYEIYDQSLRGINDFKITEMFWWRDPRYTKDLQFLKVDDLIHFYLNRDEYPDLEIVDFSETLPSDRDYDEIQKLMDTGYKPTSNWFEMTKPNSASRVGIEITATDSKGKVNKFSRFETLKFIIPRNVSYSAGKKITAYSADTGNSGYISIYGSTPDVESNSQAKTSLVTVDTENFPIKGFQITSDPYVKNYVGQAEARIDLTAQPTRSVTFEAKVS